MLIFMLIYQNSDSPLISVLPVEAVVDTGLGFVFFGNKMMGLIMSLITPTLIASPMGE